MKQYLISIIAFAFFIVCPRMAGMTHIITKSTGIGMLKVALFGTILSLPLVLLMVVIFSRFGLWAALGFAVITDFAAAFFMKEISIKAGVETLVIALFIIAGVKFAGFLTSKLF